jgi:AcrR family transcriptional regulator
LFNFAGAFKFSMDKYNDKQIEIIQVAEKLFALDGFDGTSVRVIASQANVNVAMISYYFGSKERLLESIVLFRINGLRLQLENLVVEDLSPIEKMDKIIEYYIQQVLSNMSIHQIIQNEFTNKKRDFNLHAFTEVKKSNLALIKHIITEGQLQGVFKESVNAELITPMIIGPIIYFKLNKLFYKDLLTISSDADYDFYIKSEFTIHLQKTIKALLLHEN